jgi:hypothetical protein
MSVEALAAWLLAIMLATVPPGKAKRPDEARETAAQGRARYAAIARAMAEVSLDADEAPLFDGPHGREKTAALLLTISLHESHWRRDVDLGLGAQKDSRYRCMMQILVPGEKTPEGWSGDDLVKSRERCFRRGLHILQNARKQCDSKGARAFLNHYATGTCDRGQKAVQKRWRTFDALLEKHPFPG